MKNELEFLNQIKESLLSKGEMFVVLGNPQRNKLVISSEDWHKIFKTDEFNERNHEREV